MDWRPKYPTPSPTLQYLIHCYEYWIAYADLDGFRIDALKHMGQERFFLAEKSLGDVATPGQW